MAILVGIQADLLEVRETVGSAKMAFYGVNLGMVMVDGLKDILILTIASQIPGETWYTTGSWRIE